MTFNRQLQAVYDKGGLCDTARATVDQILSGRPVRAVRSGAANVSSMFPSHKNGYSVQAESQAAELAFILQSEFDKKVFAFACQPMPITLKYPLQNGKKGGHRHTPDFLVVYVNGYIAFYEVTTRAEAEKRASKWPERIRQDENGRWISPAGQAAAAEIGLGYEVWVSDKPDVRFSLNARYLWEFFRTNPTDQQQKQIHSLQNDLDERKTLRISDLNEAYSPEIVNYAIAHHYIYCRLWTDDIARDPEACVYANKTYSDADLHTASTSRCAPPPSLNLAANTEINWDGKPWRIVNVGDNAYTLKAPDGSLETLAPTACEELIRAGNIRPVSETPNDQNRLDLIRKQGSEEQIERANHRIEQLRMYWDGCSKDTLELKARTCQKWSNRFRQADDLHGDGFLGLIDAVPRRGNRKPRLSKAGREVLEQSLWRDYAKNNAPTISGAHRSYLVRAREAGVDTISLEGYRKWTKRIDKGEVVGLRSGAKAKYQLGPEPLDGADELSMRVPHGQRAFECVHIDHTKLPVGLRSCVTGEYLGTPWLSVMQDAFSRVILAHVLTFESPSTRVLMLLFRECVRRNKRLMQRATVDAAYEFDSLYFNSLLSRYHIEKVPRKAGCPRDGSLIESQFGSTEIELIRQLRGSTANLEHDRSLSSSHHPEKTALWTADELDKVLEMYFYDVFPYRRHAGIHDTPANRFDESMRSVGQANGTYIPYDMAFFVRTLPEVSNGTRKIRKGQVRVDHLDYRPIQFSAQNNDAETVTVRQDPYNPSYVFVFVDGDWREFRTTNTLLAELITMRIQHVALEIAGRAANTNKSYRKPSAQALDFVKAVQEAEGRLQLAAERPDLNQSPKTEAISNGPDLEEHESDEKVVVTFESRSTGRRL